MANTEEFGCSDEEYGKCCWPGPCRVDRQTRSLLPPIDESLHTPEVIAGLQERALAPSSSVLGRGLRDDTVRAVAWRAIPIGKENARSGRWIGENAEMWSPVSIRHQIRTMFAEGIVMREERDMLARKGVCWHYWRES